MIYFKDDNSVKLLNLNYDSTADRMAPSIEIQSISNGRQLNIEEFVKNTTWRELLIELVEKHELDPWNINISAMVDGYIGIIKEMKTLDLRVPANVILAASILLRMKSDGFELFDNETNNDEIDSGMQSILKQRPEVPELVQKNRIQPYRKITLDELMDALSSAIKYEEKKIERIREIETPIHIDVGEDIDKRIETLYTIIKENADPLGMTTFSILSKNFESIELKLLNLFIPMLFLAQYEKINVIQEEFFGELIIKINEDINGAK